MIFAALNEAADRGELLLVAGGMCRFHRRRDGVVVVREIVVLPTHRRAGVGRALIETVRKRFPEAPIEAKCPLGYASNWFWVKMGFELIDTVGKVNVWRLDPN